MKLYLDKVKKIELLKEMRDKLENNASDKYKNDIIEKYKLEQELNEKKCRNDANKLKEYKERIERENNRINTLVKNEIEKSRLRWNRIEQINRYVQKQNKLRIERRNKAIHDILWSTQKQVKVDIKKLNKKTAQRIKRHESSSKQKKNSKLSILKSAVKRVMSQPGIVIKQIENIDD